jgi:thioredoxin type arsenate reductase
MSATAIEFLDLLGNKNRWKLVSALAKSDFSVSELQKKVRVSQNLVSYHLGQLKKLKLVNESRSIADGREVYYSLNLELIRKLFFALGDSLHPALNPENEGRAWAGSKPKVRVLFVCTHNSARSQMAEGLLRFKAGERVDVFSAGTEATHVNPLAIDAMKRLGVDISSQESKNLDGFLGKKFDYVITVCDRAKESCPIFPGAPEQIHWSFPDPSEVKGSQEDRAKAFDETAQQLSQRINFLLMMIER